MTLGTWAEYIERENFLYLYFVSVQNLLCIFTLNVSWIIPFLISDLAH